VGRRMEYAETILLPGKQVRGLRTFDLWVMSVPVIGYVDHNKARVALERALGNPLKRVTGVDWESKFTFGTLRP
jgi:hypothetical protein